MEPACVVRNFTPSSTKLKSPASAVPGVVDSGKIEHGHCGGPMVTDRLTTVPMFTLSSIARTMTVAAPIWVGVQLNVQDARPVAAFQVVPPSTETSTRASWPPPTSAAVPDMDTGESTGSV